MSEYSIIPRRQAFSRAQATIQTLALAVCLSGLLSSCGNNPMDRALAGITEDHLKAHVEYLASDACDGRLPFTAGADRAVAYLKDQLEALGLQPIDGKTYLQQVPLVQIRTEVPEYVEVSTPGGAARLAEKKDISLFTQSLAPELDIREARLFFAGYGIVAPEYGKNDYQGLADPENQIAVVFVNDPGLGRQDSYFRGDTMTYYGRWTYKYEEGARQGLKGVLIIHDDRGAGYGWSVVGASDVRFALDGQADEGCPLRGWLSQTAARDLLARCGYDLDALKEQAKRPDFKPFALDAKLSVHLRSTFERAESPNVVGYIQGETDESVVCTAHWDHLGHAAEPVAGDSIINGASDNATAMAWLLETARAFKALGKKPRRNIVFLFPTCEEKGMFGSAYYVAHPPFPIEKTAAVVNMDVYPLWGENNDLTITGYGYSDLDSLVAPLAAEQGRYVMPDPEASNGMFYRSDHLPFMRRGVPAMFAKGWNDNRLRGKEWSKEAVARYWAETYHKPSDQTAPEDDYSGLKQETELFFKLIHRLAYSDFRPRWREGAEFSASSPSPSSN